VPPPPDEFDRFILGGTIIGFGLLGLLGVGLVVIIAALV
jgi:hypothetical protein